MFLENEPYFMRAKLLFIIIMLFLASAATAKDEGVSLVLLHRNGGTAYFNLDEQPVTTFTKEYLEVTTQRNEFSFPLSGVSEAYFDYDISTSIIDCTTRAGIMVNQKGNNIIVNGLTDGYTVAIYSIEGKMMLSGIATGVAPVMVSLDGLPNGVYVVKADYVTFKTLKR
jgi:hypothetical protein